MATGTGSIKKLISLTNIMFLLDLNITEFHKWPFCHLAINVKSTAKY